MLVRCVLALVAVLLATSSPVLSTPHYSSFYNETFPWNVAANPTVPALGVSSTANGGKVSLTNTAFNKSPFTSVYNVNVTVDAVKNLAYPFTGPTGTYQDVDTGIDVVAGGSVTFFIPAGYSGGQWCFELGRAGAGNQYCAGPAGAPYSGSDPTLPAYLYNAKINGAYPSSDPAVPLYLDVTNPALGNNTHAGYSIQNNVSTQWNLTQYGTNRGFTWTRSGSIVFRIGAYPSAGQTSTTAYNFNDPTTDYDSALDSTAENNHPPSVIPAAGWVGRSILTPISGRLFVACWRWNLWPALNYGQTYIMINYTSPVQLAVSWSPAVANTSAASYSSPTIIAQQPLNSSITLPDTFSASFQPTSLNATLRAFVPVENITVSSFSPQNTAVAPLLQSSFSYHYPNQRLVPAVLNGPTVTSCCYGGQSAYYQWNNGGKIAQYDGMFATLVAYNGNLAWDMTHVLDSNSSSPFFPSSGTFQVNTINNQWYPQSREGSYQADVDTGLNALEGGTITLSAPVQTWCMATYSNNASQLCSDARGVQSFSYYGTQQTFLIGCDQFYWIFPNSTIYNQNAYDNSGCNSGSISEPPNGALLLRVGSSNQGHSPIDYATAFNDRTQTGTLTATYRVPASGRIYLSAAVMYNPNILSYNSANFGAVTQMNTAFGTPYSGSQSVTVTYTPPAEVSFGFTWSPQISTSGMSLPMAVTAPTALTSSALTAAGFTMVPASDPTATGLGVGATTGQYIYYVLPEKYGSTTTVYTSTMYAYQDLAESDYTATSSSTQPTNPTTSSSSGGTVSPVNSGSSSTGGSQTPSRGAASSTAGVSATLLAFVVAVAFAMLA